ncbi:hypothetical protein OROMI_023701 [Orobanche minor]
MMVRHAVKRLEQQALRQELKLEQAQKAVSNILRNFPSVYPASPKRKAVPIGLGENLAYTPKEINVMKTLLYENFGFLEENITTMPDCGNYQYAEKRATRNTTKNMVNTAKERDILLLLVTGHASNVNGNPAIYPSHDKDLLTNLFWKNLIDKVPLKVTLTVFWDTCFAGAFFKRASELSQTRGEVVVFEAASENETTYDDKYLHDTVEPILRKLTTEITNSELQRKIKRSYKKEKVKTNPVLLNRRCRTKLSLTTNRTNYQLRTLLYRKPKYLCTLIAFNGCLFH